jgi:hypothetical protein
MSFALVAAAQSATRGRMRGLQPTASPFTPFIMDTRCNVLFDSVPNPPEIARPLIEGGIDRRQR